MTFEQFNLFQDNLLGEVGKMADTKGKEYANSETDRFDNFNRLSQRLGIDRKLALWVFTVKHLDSIESFLKKGRTFSEEKIQGRIVDVITYLTLLAGIIHEEDQMKPKCLEEDRNTLNAQYNMGQREINNKASQQGRYRGF